MFEGIREWLDSLTPQQKEILIQNLKNFSRLKACLEGKGSLIKDEKNGNLVIVKDHVFADEFIKVYQNMTMRGVVLIDNRKGKNITIEAKK